MQVALKCMNSIKQISMSNQVPFLFKQALFNTKIKKACSLIGLK